MSLCANADLLQQLTRMPVREDPIRRQIVRRIHDSASSPSGPCPRRSRRSLHRHTIPCDRSTISAAISGRTRENHRRRIAPWIGHQPGSCNLFPVQLGHPVHGLGLCCGGDVRTFIFKLIHRPILGVREPPCAAQIDNAQSVLQSLRNPFTRLLMRSCQKQQFDTLLSQLFPREGLYLSDWLPLLSASCG